MPRSRAKARDRPQFGRIEGLAGDAAHRRLDRDRADRHRDPHLRRACDRLLDFGQRDRRAPRRQRHQRQPAEMRCAVAFVVPQMAFLLHQHPPPAPLRPEAAPRDGWPGCRSAGKPPPPCRAAPPSVLRVRRRPRRASNRRHRCRAARRSPPAVGHIPPATGRARRSGTARPDCRSFDMAPRSASAKTGLAYRKPANREGHRDDKSAAQRLQGDRSDRASRRSDRGAAARRLGRRCHQDRGARRAYRRDRQPPRRSRFPESAPQQAVADARPEKPGGEENLLPARREGRCRRRELQIDRQVPARRRLRCRAQDQSAHRLRLDLGVRAGRAV